MLLEKIHNINDIHKIAPEDYEALAAEIREFLIDKVSMTGGHIASNLGVVELTMALHLALNLENDVIVWDVGHQSYVHKILTGRWKDFDTLRQQGGLSGFPKRRECRYDGFNTGHSSTSISAALGIAKAAELGGDDKTVVAVIGDGSFTGGMAYEALNNASKLNRNLLIVLNDNNMSISQNVGGFSTYLSNIRAGENYIDMKAGVVRRLEKLPNVGEKMVKSLRKTKSSIKQLFVPGMLFENMGITYLGPFDGHDISSMLRIFNEAKNLDHAVVVHVKTIKGKGYKPAEERPNVFHGIGPFDKETGQIVKKITNPSWTKVFSDALLSEAEKNDRIVAITAAMADGTGLDAFREKYPDRFFDVGIAEEHAVTFAAGLAVGGLKPFVAIYSSFLQRGYDQILSDVCMQGLPVVFCIDRAGLVGNDGETHQGIFDYSYLTTIPNMNVFAPKNAAELEMAIKFAAGFNAPLAIRYPRGESYTGLGEFESPIVFGKSEILYEERDIAILAAGTMVEAGEEVRKRLLEKGFRNVTLVNARFIKPIDEDMIDRLAVTHHTFITMEENVINAGYGMAVLRYINDNHSKIKVINIAIPNSFVEQATQAEQRKESRIDADSVMERLENELNEEKA